MADNKLLVPVAQIAKLFNDLTERRVQQLAADGIIPRTERGLYPLVESVRGYVGFLQERAFGKSDTNIDSHTERTRLLSAQAEKTELEVAEIKGHLVSADIMHKQDAMLANTLKNNLLSMPDRIAALVAAESAPEKVHELITDEVLHSLQTIIEKLAGAEVDDATLDITRSIAHQYLDEQDQDQEQDTDEPPALT